MAIEAASSLFPLYHLARVHGEWGTGMETESGRFELALSLGLLSGETLEESQMKDEIYFSEGDGVVSLFDSWPFLYVLLLVPAGLLFREGFQTKTPGRVTDRIFLKEAALFGGIYTLCMLLLVHWKTTRVQAEIEGSGTLLQWGAPLFSTGLITFLFAAAFYILGAYVQKRSH